MIADLLQRWKQLGARIRGRAADPNDIDALIERIGARHTPEDRRRAYALFLSNALYAPVISLGERDDAKSKPGDKTKSKKAQKKTQKKASKKTAKKKKAAKHNGASGDAPVDQRMNLAMAGVNGFQMLLMYTSGDDERIARDAEHQLSLPGRRAFEMTLQTEGVDGLLIHNKRNAWMALPNELLREILEVFPEDG